MKKTVALIALLSTLSLHASGWEWFFGAAEPAVVDVMQQEPEIVIAPQTMLTTIFTLHQSIPTGSGPDFIAYSPTGRFAAVPNANDDSLSVYRVDASTGTFTEVAGSPYATGTVPNFVAFSPCERYAAVTSSTINPPSGNRADSSIFIYSIDCESGEFSLLQTITLDDDSSLSLPTSIAYSPDGRFAAVTNFGPASTADGISIYRVSKTSGKFLLPSLFINPGSSRQPFVVAYHPTGRSASVTFFGSARVGTFQVDPVTGGFVNQTMQAAGGRPQGLAYSHDGNFLTIVSTISQLRTYPANSATGRLVPPPQVSATGANSAYDAYSRDDTILAVTNRGSNDVFAYCVDQAGTLSAIASVIPVPEPWGIAFAPCSDFVAITSFSTNTVQIFKVDKTICP